MSELAKTDATVKQHRARTRIRVWLVLAFAVAVFIAANAHLIYIAITSQPACVTHLKQGEGAAERGLFTAAQSSCSPPASVKADHS
jgi:hypothetical protein